MVHKTNAVVIFINQLREKIGNQYGSPEVTTGGRALKFYSSFRLDVRRIEDLKNGSDIIGTRTKIKVTKNKVAPPFKTAEVELYYGEGFSREACLLDLGEKYKVINKSASWYSFNETRLGQGRENVRQFLKENPEMCSDIENKIKEIIPPVKDNVIHIKRDAG